MLFLQIYKKGVLFFVETMNYSGYNLEYTDTPMNFYVTMYKK